MSLEEMIPEDKGPIDSLDDAIVRYRGKIAKFWQDKSYKSKDILASHLHGAAACALGTCAIQGNYIMVLPCMIELFKYAYGLKNRLSSDDAEKMKCEAVRMPVQLPKFANFFIYSLGAGVTAIGAGALVGGLISNDSKLVSDAAYNLTWGVGNFFWGTADYLDKSEIEKPPRGPKRKSLKEWLKEKARALIPEPVPEPVTEPTRYSA